MTRYLLFCDYRFIDQKIRLGLRKSTSSTSADSIYIILSDNLAGNVYQPLTWMVTSNYLFLYESIHSSPYLSPPPLVPAGVWYCVDRRLSVCLWTGWLKQLWVNFDDVCTTGKLRTRNELIKFCVVRVKTELGLRLAHLLLRGNVIWRCWSCALYFLHRVSKTSRLWLAIIFTYTVRLQQFLAKMLPKK